MKTRNKIGSILLAIALLTSVSADAQVNERPSTYCNQMSLSYLLSKPLEKVDVPHGYIASRKPEQSLQIICGCRG